MRLTERSYPYPAVGNRDDVPSASFQSTVTVTFDASMAYIDISIANSSVTIIDMIGRSDAYYLAHVECSNTLHRLVHRSARPQFRVAIAKDLLNNVVEVNVVAVSSKNVADYKVAGQHEEYGDHTFHVKKGDILATYPSQQFTIDRDYGSFRKTDSIVTIIRCQIILIDR